MSHKSSLFLRANQWISHYADCLMVGYMATLAIWGFLDHEPARRANNHLDLADWVLVIASGLVVSTIVSGMITHNLGLCDYCMVEFPLDGSERAEKHRARLRFWHWRGYWLLYGLLFAGLLIWPNHWWWHNLVYVALTCLAGYRAFCFMTHRKLLPWCPWCNWDGGGFKEPSPEPTPDPSLTRDPQ